MRAAQPLFPAGEDFFQDRLPELCGPMKVGGGDRLLANEQFFEGEGHTASRGEESTAVESRPSRKEKVCEFAGPSDLKNLLAIETLFFYFLFSALCFSPIRAKVGMTGRLLNFLWLESEAGRLDCVGDWRMANPTAAEVYARFGHNRSTNCRSLATDCVSPWPSSVASNSSAVFGGFRSPSRWRFTAAQTTPGA